MGSFSGMDPDHARTIAAALAIQFDALDSVTAEVERSRQASLNPFSYGFDLGQWVIAPFSIALVHLAHLQLSNARVTGRSMIERLQREIAEQERASAAGSGSDILVRIGVRVTAADLAAASPKECARWWESLSLAERAALIAEDPALIGNVEGIPYSDRDRANREQLKRLLADDTITGGQREALESVKKALDVGTKVTTQLIILEFPAGSDPRAAIAFGNVDDADSVGIIVPGRDNTVSKDMTNLAKAAQNLYLEQEHQLESGYGVSGGQHSVIAWMGYQTPGGGLDNGVFFDELAVDGGRHLTDTLAGIDAVHANSGQESLVIPFAFSYGSRAAASSLSNGGSADGFVMFGSAGLESDITSASQLNVPNGEVYATEARGDDDADKGREWFGSGRLDPSTDDGFGAKQFGSDGTGSYKGTDKHALLLFESSGGEKNGYMDLDTESLRNMALIGLGEADRVTNGRGGR